MAYAAAVTYAYQTILGRQHTIVTVVETGVTLSTHEWSASVPQTGTLTFHKSTLVASGVGAVATTVDPIMGEATGATGVFANGAAAAAPRNAPDARYRTDSGVLYGRSGSDGDIGSTGTITTVLICVDGHI